MPNRGGRWPPLELYNPGRRQSGFGRRKGVSREKEVVRLSAKRKETPFWAASHGSATQTVDVDSLHSAKPPKFSGWKKGLYAGSQLSANSGSWRVKET